MKCYMMMQTLSINIKTLIQKYCFRESGGEFGHLVFKVTSKTKDISIVLVPLHCKFLHEIQGLSLSLIKLHVVELRIPFKFLTI